MSYESPITIIYGEAQTQIEDGMLKAVQDVGFNVNKIELQKALMYDRKQYTQGFEDGKKFAEQELIRHGHWVRSEDADDGYCSECHCDIPMFKVDWEWQYIETPCCPNCGAKMDEVME